MELDNLDFTQDQERNPSARPQVGRIPLPDELPKSQDFSHLPKEILKSSTVENLISQNEDLMARLKVALRRLSILELENQRHSEEIQRARLSQSASSDQMLVLKEKDNIWKAKVDQAEREKEIFAEKYKKISTSMSATMAELDRYHKYHERIKTQVKPYIAQLKEYSKNQTTKNQELHQQLEHKEAQLQDIRRQMIEVTKNSRSQVEMTEKRSHELTHFYESQIEKMKAELSQLQEANRDLETKALKLPLALERQDQLENELVEITRSKEDLKNRTEKDIQRLQERASELTRHNQKLGIEHADLQVRVLHDQEQINRLDRENSQLQEQLESLRYMWTAKNDEVEKLKAGMSSLEKLNLELSQKMNDIRQQNN